MIFATDAVTLTGWDVLVIVAICICVVFVARHV